MMPEKSAARAHRFRFSELIMTGCAICQSETCSMIWRHGLPGMDVLVCRRAGGPRSDDGDNRVTDQESETFHRDRKTGLATVVPGQA